MASSVQQLSALLGGTLGGSPGPLASTGSSSRAILQLDAAARPAPANEPSHFQNVLSEASRSRLSKKAERPAAEAERVESSDGEKRSAGAKKAAGTGKAGRSKAASRRDDRRADRAADADDANDHSEVHPVRREGATAVDDIDDGSVAAESSDSPAQSKAKADPTDPTGAAGALAGGGTPPASPTDPAAGEPAGDERGDAAADAAATVRPASAESADGTADATAAGAAGATPAGADGTNPTADAEAQPAPGDPAGRPAGIKLGRPAGGKPGPALFGAPPVQPDVQQGAAAPAAGPQDPNGVDPAAAATDADALADLAADVPDVAAQKSGIRDAGRADADPLLSPTDLTPAKGPQHPHGPSPAADAPAPDATPEARFAEANHSRIVSGVRGELLPNGGSMQLRLDPPELGDLLVNVHLKDGVMTAAFQTSNADATRLLSHSLTDLKAQLEAQGVTVERLHVQQQSPRDDRNPSGDPNQRNPTAEDQQNARREQQRREMVQRLWDKLAKGKGPLDLVA